MKTSTAIAILVGILIIGAFAYIQISNIAEKAVEVKEMSETVKNIATSGEENMKTAMSERFNVERVEGVAENNMLKYLLIRVKPGVGGKYIDLHKARLAVNVGNLKRSATYVPVMGKTSACDAEVFKLMKEIGTYDWTTFVKAVAKNLDPTKFTVVWDNCDNKDDVYTLSDGQTAYVIYPLPQPVPSSTYITIDLYVSDGWSNPMKIRVPENLDKGFARIYP